jgi:hypothetical protein
MSVKSFITGLLLTLGIQIVVCGGLMLLLPALKAHTGFVAVTMVVMALVCILLFVLARRAAANPMHRLFIQLVMVSVFAKMLVCLAVVIGYEQGFAPADHTYIWPFLVVYISSTVFEVIFLGKTGRKKPRSNT